VRLSVWSVKSVAILLWVCGLDVSGWDADYPEGFLYFPQLDLA